MTINHQPRYRSTWVTRTVQIIGSIVAVIMITFSGLRLSELIIRESTMVDHTIPSDGIDELHLNLAAGTVVIGDSATINDQQAAIQISGNLISGFATTELDVVVIDNRVIVSSSCPPQVLSQHCSTDLVVSVPEHVTTFMQSSHVDVALERLSAPVELRVARSTVRGHEVSGDVTIRGSLADVIMTHMSSNHVDIESSFQSVDLQFVSPPETVRIHTTAMPIRVEVPADDTSYNVQLRNQFGSTANHIRNDPSSDRRIDLRSTFDDVVVTYPDASGE